MASKKIEIDIIINNSQSAKTVGELKNSLNEIKQTLGEIGDEGSDDFKKLNSALDEVSGKLTNVGNAAGTAVNPLDKLKLTAEKFDGISKTLSGSISLAAGAFGLMGGAGEKVTKVMLKVQSAIAISNGIKDLSDGFVKLASSTGIASTAQKAYTAFMGASTGALKLFKLAVMGTGIGFLVVGLAALIANFDKVKEAVLGVISNFQFLTNTVDTVKSALEFLGIVESGEEKKSKKIQEERFKRYQKNREDFIKNSSLIQDELQREIDIQKSLGKDVTDLEIKKRKARQETLDKLIKETELEIKLRKAFGVITDEEYQKQLDYVAGLKKENADLATQITVINNEVIVSNKEKNAKINEDNKKKEEEEKKIRDDGNADAIKSRDKAIKKENDNNMAEIQLRLLSVEEGSKAELDILKEQLELERKINLQDDTLTATERKLIDQQYFADVAVLEDEFIANQKEKTEQARADRQAAITKGLGQASQALNDISGLSNAIFDAQLTKVDEKYKKQLEGVEKGSEEEFKILVKKTNEENKIKKKQFEVNKKVQIAQAVITTATSALSAFGALAGIPIVGPILGGIAAAAAVATGIAQIAKIKATTFDAAPLPSAPSADGAGATADSISSATGSVNSPTPNQTTLFGTAGNFNNGGQQQGLNTSVRAYVVESDVTDTQERVSRFRTAAEIG